MIRVTTLLLALAIAIGPLVASQQPEFEVISVKLHTSDDQREMMVAQPGGRFVAVNIPLRMLIRTAFQLQDDQVVGGPDWITERFDIDARAAGTSGPPGPELLGMLQSLLTSRFKLTSHREQREIAVFALEHSRSDRTLGSGLRPTACPEFSAEWGRPQTCANIASGFGSLTLRGMPLEQFTSFLSPQVNRVVIDRTGLDGRYDIDLKWTPERPGQTAMNPDDLSIFTALQEQLGLKLTATRAPVDVLVIDSLARPAEN